MFRIASKESRLCKEFKNLENIGAGGSGCVYKAIHRLDDQQCAIKRIKEKKGFEHEIDLNFAIIKKLAMFTHPNIVPYKDVWIERVSQPPSPTTSESSDSSEDTKALSNNEYPLNSNSNPNSPTESHELNPIESSDDSDEQQIHPNDRNGDGNVKHQLTKINKFDNINKTADSNVISNDDKSDESDGISFRGGSSTGSNDRSIPSPSDPVIPMDDNKVCKIDSNLINNCLLISPFKIILFSDVLEYLFIGICIVCCIFRKKDIEFYTFIWHYVNKHCENG